MESIKSILQTRQFDEPSSIIAIKDYIFKNFNYEANIKISDKTFIVSVASAPLANTLKMRQLDIIKRCDLKNYKLIFRVL